LDYEQAGVPASSASAFWAHERGWLAAMAFLLFARFVWLWKQRGWRFEIQ
jgi:hypothetical protein